MNNRIEYSEERMRQYHLLPFLFLIGSLQFLYANPFAKVKTPSKDTTEAVGSYANGCIFGAKTLPKEGQGFHVMRQSRNRYYGHDSLVTYVKEIGQQMSIHNQLLLVGDMSQPRGGRMPSDHASHQMGLDVDIWLYEMTPQQFSKKYIETLSMRSVVDRAKGVLNQYWREGYVEQIAIAASSSDVDRIFINPIIKKELCRVAEKAPWQYKIRPWYGHDSHFHVRLKCPKDNSDCLTQAPIPKVSGCDKGLDNWIRDQIAWTTQPKKPAKKTPTVPVKKPNTLPLRCHLLVN